MSKCLLFFLKQKGKKKKILVNDCNQLALALVCNHIFGIIITPIFSDNILVVTVKDGTSVKWQRMGVGWMHLNLISPELELGGSTLYFILFCSQLLFFFYQLEITETGNYVQLKVYTSLTVVENLILEKKCKMLWESWL